MKIPFVNLTSQYKNIQKEIDSAIASVINDTAFISGKYAKKFEEEWADYVGLKYCISCANGTDSLEILLQAFGIGGGDEVIVPANTWISTAECVVTNRATPVFVDTHPEYFTINVSLIEEKITSSTKAIIPVHLYGCPVDMDPLMDLARKYNLLVIEDCAQAHGAKYKGKNAGTYGDAASFSFYPGKNLGAYGDAGAMLTNNEDIAAKVRMIANHGQQGKHNHIISGRNSRMSGINAAVLSAKLKYLDEWNNVRRSIAMEYNKILSGGKIKTPIIPEYAETVYHIYSVMINNRNNVKKLLESQNISSGIHYPVAQPLLEAFAHLANKSADYPVAVEQTTTQLSLPIYPELKKNEIEYVCKILFSSVK